MADRELKVIISGDASSLNKAFKSVDSGASSLSKGLKTLGKVAAVGVGAAFAGLAVTLKRGFDEVSEGQQVLAQTNAVLKSTGGIANVTAKDVDSLAQSLSQLTGVDDEAVAATENLLLTFKNIRNEAGAGNDIFNQTTTAVLDMTTAMNNGAIPTTEQLNSSTIRLGKALNDPVKGITALTRVGVTFTEGQKKQIAEMVKSGDVMGAQKMILKELSSEFGGAAAAAGETLPGQLSKLRNSFDEVAGAVFEKLLPYLTQFLDWVNQHMPEIQAVIEGVMDAIVIAIDKATTGVQKAIDFFQNVWDKAQEVWPQVADIIGVSLGEIDEDLNVTRRGMSDFQVAHDSLWDKIKAREQQAKAWYEGEFAPALKNVLKALRLAWETFGDAIVSLTKGLVVKIAQPFKELFNILGAFVRTGLAVLRGDWRKALDQIVDEVREKMANILGFFRSFPGRIKGSIGNLSGLLVDAGRQVLAGFYSGLTEAWEKVKSFVSGIAGWIRDHKGPESKDLQLLNRAGVLIMQGLENGLVSGFAKVQRLVDGMGDEIKDRMSKVVDAAAQAVTAKQSVLTEAFSELINNALAAFDVLASGVKTKSEKALAAFDLKQATEAAKKRVQELKDALTEATDALNKFQSQGPEQLTQGKNESAEDFAARQLEAQKRFEEERTRLIEQQGQAQQNLNDELEAQRLAKQRAALETAAAKERKALEDRQGLQRRHFEEELTELQKKLATGELTQDQAQQRLLKLFKKYHIPFKNAAGLLGSALAEGLRDSFADVRKATRELANTIADELAKIKIVVDVSIKRSASGKDNNKTPGRALGGPVRQGNLYVVGERGPEFFVPNQSGTIIPNGGAASGGGTYIFQFPNYLGDKRDLERSLQQMMRRFEDSNGISFTGRALA